jgi:hypothetical protein
MRRGAHGAEEAYGAGNGEIPGEALQKRLHDAERRNRALERQLELYMSEAYLAQSALSECAQQIEIISATEAERSRQQQLAVVADQVRPASPAVVDAGVGADCEEMDEAAALEEALLVSEMALEAALIEHDRMSLALQQAHGHDRHIVDELRAELSAALTGTHPLQNGNGSVHGDRPDPRMHAENSRSRGLNGGGGSDAYAVQSLHKELRRAHEEVEAADQRSRRAVEEAGAAERRQDVVFKELAESQDECERLRDQSESTAWAEKAFAIAVQTANVTEQFEARQYGVGITNGREVPSRGVQRQ